MDRAGRGWRVNYTTHKPITCRALVAIRPEERIAPRTHAHAHGPPRKGNREGIRPRGPSSSRVEGELRRRSAAAAQGRPEADARKDAVGGGEGRAALALLRDRPGGAV